MSEKVSELMTKFSGVRSDPSLVQELILSPIDSMLDDDYDVVDPNNPFAFIMESIAYTSSAAVNETETLLRRAFPSMAQTYSELYHHMSDIDYVDRFCTPATADFTLILSLDEIKSRAVKVDDNVSKITIPKDTEFTVDGYSFTMLYAIEIRVLKHGGIQIVYNNDEINPIETLKTNVVDWSIRQFNSGGQLGSGKMVVMTIPTKQFKIKSYFNQLNESTGFNKTYNFDDQFFYCRVYTSTDTTEWKEIITTHSDQTYDSSKTTAVLTVTDGQVNVRIPQIYFSKGINGKNIRIDIYTSKGEMSLNLESYPPASYSAVWNDRARYEVDTNKAIRAFSNKTMFSTSVVADGADGLTFDELRDRVINNTLGVIDVPITDAHLTGSLTRNGYNIIKVEDSITNRDYIASRSLPEPTNTSFSSPMGSLIKTYQSTFNSLKGRTNVLDNGDRMTIKSGTLFQLGDDGKLTMVDNTTIQQLEQMGNESKVSFFNNSSYFVTPFHYVLDATDSVFMSRPFYLDSPTIKSKEFVSENQTTLLQITTIRYAIDKTDSGYNLVVVAEGGDIIKAMDTANIHPILSYTPPGEIVRASMVGTILGKDSDDNLIISFNIDTKFDIDSKDRLQVTSFTQYDNSPRTVGMSLDTVFDIIYAVTDYSVEGISKSNIDTIVGNYLISGDFYSITQERLDISLGMNLKYLWSRSRSVASSNDYTYHQTDVVNVYPKDVFQTDPVTGVYDLEYDSDAGTYNLVKLHSAGDTVYVNGEVDYKHRAGDPVLDENGMPVIVEGRQTLRQFDLFLIEAIFTVSDDTSIVNYLDGTIDTVVSWVDNYIASIGGKLYENTNIWFYPKNNVGSVSGRINNNTPVSLSAEQSFTVKFYLTETGYRNDDLKESLKTLSKSVIRTHLAKKTISVVEIEITISEMATDDIVGVVVSGLGGSADYDLVTLDDDDVSLTIAKRAYVLPNDVITIEDDITYEWVQHSV